MSKASKRFCFNQGDNLPMNKKESKEVKKGRFNFNDFQQQPMQENQYSKFNNDTFMQTKDSLNSKTLASQYQSTTTPIIAQQINFAKKAPQLTGKPKEKDAKILETQRIASYLHTEQFTYIEGLFGELLNDQKTIAFLKLMNQAKFGGNDRFAKEEALIFLLLDNLLKNDFTFVVNSSYANITQSKIPFNENKLTNLKKWAIFVLRKQSDLLKLEEKKGLRHWMMLAENRIGELTQQFLSESHYDEAILASNLQDKAFLQSYEYYTSKLMKQQYTYLQSKNIKITPVLAWIVDFAIAIQYFDQTLLSSSIQDICYKYQATSHQLQPALLPCLVALTLHFSETSRNDKIQKLIQMIMLQQKRLSYLDQVLYFYTLKQYKNRFPKLFKKVAESLITKVHSLSLFIDILKFGEFNQQQIVSSISLLYEKNKDFSQNRKERTKQLYQSIVQKVHIPNLNLQQSLALSVLKKWRHCQIYLNLFEDKKYMQSASYFSRHFQEIQNSPTHSSKILLDILIKNLVKFQLACSYKQSKRKQYYQILQELRPQLKQKDDIIIVDGCIAFTELKFKVFWLHNQEKFSHFYELFNFLKKLSTETSFTANSTSFLTNIRKTLSDILVTLDGKLYLGELSDAISDKNERENIAKMIKKQLKQKENLTSSDFAKSQIFKILEMVNWNETIGNMLVIKLLFG